jgi:OmcA/MtrC family decaheme c-type cytochrome
MRARVLLAASLTIAALSVGAGCKGDQGPAGAAGPPGDAGPPGPPGNNAVTVIKVPSNTVPPTDAASAAWAALAPQVTVQSVSISSPPVVHFTVTDAAGTPVVGLSNTSKGSGAKFAGLTNLSFALAKLVPETTDSSSGRSTSPARWVSYIVTTVETTTAAPTPTRPTTDNTGTLVDNGDGSYVYTFYRDVPGIKAAVDGMTVTAPNDKADLGDLTYQPALVHRLTIQLSGNAPGTSTNTPTGTDSGIPGVAMVHPVDAIYDFIPSTNQVVTDSGRDIVATQKCNECHRQLGGIPGDDPESSGAGFHGGNRNDTHYCVVCHTEQRKYGRTEATFDATLTFTTSSTNRLYGRAIGNFPNQIHHIHAGPVLALKPYNYGGVVFNEVLFPQDLRNCTKCHDGSATSTAKTPEGNNWMLVPSRLACGGCHDGIDFATGMGVTLADAAAGKTQTTIFGGLAHGGGAQPDDTQCSACHADPTRPGININYVHLPVTPPNAQNALAVTGGNANTNAAWIASNPARLPSGAVAVSYDIQSVSVNASKQPVIVFRILQNGARKDLNDFATTTPNPATGQKEIWDNFMGSPSLYFVFAVPQDGIMQPADFNSSASGYLRSIWNSTSSGTGKGTLSGPDANGYYTGTLTGVTIPTSAVMLTGGLGYSYNVTSTLPLTQTARLAPGTPDDGTPFPDYPVTAPTATGQTNKMGGLIVIAPNAQKVAAGFNPRRPIVEDARCNACHQELGTFTEDAFHAGQRNDGTTCAWCHTPNRTSSGWSADSVYFVHAIHAAAKREVPFHWDATSTTDSFADIKFPGVLKDCETCHLPGAYDFSATASQAALPNRLFRTAATGAFNPTPNTTITSYTYNSGSQTCVAGQSSPQTALGAFELSPYIAPFPTTYGVGFSFNAGLNPSNPSCRPDGTVVPANPAGGTIQADGVSLVNSPIAAVCFACHDSSADIAHFELNGGAIYAPRNTALNAIETCLICHGSGKIADIKVVHAQ